MVSKVMAEKGVTFLVVDSESENNSLQSFFVRFGNKDLAQKLLSVLKEIEKNFPTATTKQAKETNTNQDEANMSADLSVSPQLAKKESPVSSSTQVTTEKSETPKETAKETPKQTAKETPKETNKSSSPSSSKTETFHGFSTFLDGDVRGIVTFSQNSRSDNTLVEISFKGVQPDSSFSLHFDSNSLSSFKSDSDGNIFYSFENSLISLRGNNSSFQSEISLKQDSSFNNWRSQIIKDDN